MDSIGTERDVWLGCQQIRVNVRAGEGTPLVLCNGIGVGMEVLDPVVAALDPSATVIRFDAPGSGGSPASLVPYRFPYLAQLLGSLLTRLGYGTVDVLGFSWGGALAQQFAFQSPRRCRRLVLVATATGAIMAPAAPRVLARMLSRRRFTDPDYAAAIAADMYGGAVRRDADSVAHLMRQQLHAGSAIGYSQQLFATWGWTSLPALRLIRQQTLLIAGEDDPIIPTINARAMHRLLPHSRLLLHPGGHIDLLLNASELVPVVTTFLAAPVQRV